MPYQLADLTQLLLDFRDKRDWKQFHSLRNLIVSLNLESSELLELTQWKTELECEQMTTNAEAREHLAAELADVFSYLLLLAEHSGIDLADALVSKLKTNNGRYPVDKSKGSSTKYDKF